MSQCGYNLNNYRINALALSFENACHLTPDTYRSESGYFDESFLDMDKTMVSWILFTRMMPVIFLVLIHKITPAKISPSLKVAVVNNKNGIYQMMLQQGAS